MVSSKSKKQSFLYSLSFVFSLLLFLINSVAQAQENNTISIGKTVTITSKILGEKDKAIESFKKALSLDATAEETQSKLETLQKQ